MSQSTLNKSLTPFAWLSIAAAMATITLKVWAWRMTGSVGLLSDALESVVNLVAAVVALIALTIAAREPDEEHAYGHTKAEYFSSGLEGGLIILAAVGIFYTAIPRVIQPQPLEALSVGLVVAAVASVVNGLVGMRLLRAAREFRSITLESDAHHLFTDVLTSMGVIGGLILVQLTGWERLDGLLAIIIGINIIFTGYQLMKRSASGLLDTAIPENEMLQVQQVLDRYHQTVGIETHAIRSRQAGRRRFVSMHVLLPGSWSVKQGHDLVGDLERDIRTALPDTTVFTHLEPLEDSASWDDLGLDGDDHPAIAT